MVEICNPRSSRGHEDETRLLDPIAAADDHLRFVVPTGARVRGGWAAMRLQGKPFSILLETRPDRFKFTRMEQSELRPLFDLLDTPKPADLGHGPRPGVDSKAAIDSRLQSLLRELKIAPARHELIRALILLWHDHHDDAHNIVQNIETADGSFIHGIVHRREPDYWNSKYWFRRVGKHPVLTCIAEQAGALLQKSKSPLGRQLLPGGRWDPMGFIDACENASQKSGDDPEVSLLSELQKIESRCLLEYLCS